MISDKDIIQHYDECSTEYHLVWSGEDDLAIHYGFWDSGAKSHSDSLINMNTVLANKLKIKSGDVVLDAGCGIGGSSIWLSKNFGVKVIGITLSQKQVETANKFAKRHSVDHLVKFYNRDFLDTKFEDESFDIIWGIESVCHAENKKEFISEAWRILKKDGKLIVADGFITRESFTKDEQKLINKWCNGWAVPNLARVDEFEGYLRELGFRNIEFSDVTQNVMKSSLRIYRLGISGISIWKFLELLRLKTKNQVNYLIAGINQYKALKRNLWVYGIFYAEK